MTRDLHSLVKPSIPSLRSVLGRSYGGAVEVAALFALYGLYEVVRGFGSASFGLARSHTDSFVALERSLHVFGELDLQRAVERIPFLPGILGVAYITLHTVATAAVLRLGIPLAPRALRGGADEPDRRHRDLARDLRALPGRAAAARRPRLCRHGHAPGRDQHELRSPRQPLQPFAAVPSLHIGYALLVGAAVAVLAKNPLARVLGAAYPAFMLFTIVATGNHFVVDAAAGGIVTVAAFVVARRLATPRPAPSRPAGAALAVAHC